MTKRRSGAIRAEVEQVLIGAMQYIADNRPENACYHEIDALACEHWAEVTKDEDSKDWWLDKAEEHRAECKCEKGEEDEDTVGD